MQRQRRLPLDLHLHRPGEDVSHLLAGMHVPARLDPGRDLGEHLDHLPAGDRQRAALELGALELAGKRVGRRVGRHGQASCAAGTRSRAVRMWLVTPTGSAIITVWGPWISIVSAPARSAMKRSASGLIASSAPAMTAHDGSVFQAAAEALSSRKAKAVSGRCDTAAAAASSGDRLGAKRPGYMSAAISSSTAPPSSMVLTCRTPSSASRGAGKRALISPMVSPTSGANAAM